MDIDPNYVDIENEIARLELEIEDGKQSRWIACVMIALVLLALEFLGPSTFTGLSLPQSRTLVLSLAFLLYAQHHYRMKAAFSELQQFKALLRMEEMAPRLTMRIVHAIKDGH